MTAKHYNAIATIIKYRREMNYPSEYSSYRDVTTRLIAYNLADYFTTDNPKFDRTRFLAACGITECNQ